MERERERGKKKNYCAETREENPMDQLSSHLL
jgi:hypothetical protein